MENLFKAVAAIGYLAVLSFGKSKPDTKGGNGTIRDAKENMQDIVAVKTYLTGFFDLTIPEANARTDRQQYGH